MKAAPDGYSVLDPLSEHIRGIGPLWQRLDGEQLRVALRVQANQINANGSAHGGLIATLADVAISAAILRGSDQLPPSTINLSLDFTAPAQLGQWLEARTDIIRRSRRMAFAQCMISADGVDIVRASAIFKLGGRKSAG